MTIQFNPHVTFADIERAKTKAAPSKPVIDGCSQCGSADAPVEFGIDFGRERMCHRCANKAYRKIATQSHCNAREFLKEAQRLWKGAKIVSQRIH
jgi:hypothetical protein